MSPLSTSEPDLFKQTLRTVAILVGACVLFVGSLSIAAVAITSRAVAVQPLDHDTPAAETSKSAPAPKKPLSI